MLCKRNEWTQGVGKDDKTAFAKMVEHLFAVMKKVVNLLKNKDFLEILMKECEYIGKVIHKLSTFCG